MYSRVTLLEVDTVRLGVDEAVGLFRREVLPRLREQEGFEGVLVLASPEGKGMILTLWADEAGARDATGFASAELERFMTFFTAPPGRELYVVEVAELPDGVPAG